MNLDNKKTYKEFKQGNIRKDQAANEITHFFSKNFVNVFGYIFYKLRLTPNQVTAVFMITGIFGGLISFDGYVFLAYFFWRLHIIIDMADGAVARVTGLFSSYGDTLDKVGHHLIYPLYWLGFLYSMNAVYDEPFLSLIFFAISSTQWTSKHLLKDKASRPQATSLIKRLVANTMGVEGFLLFSVIQNYFELISIRYFLLFFILSNLILLLIKIANLLTKKS